MTPDEAATLAASLAWQCPAAQVVTEDVTDRFPWVRQHSLVLASQRGQRAMLVAVDGEGKTIPFPNQTNPVLNLPALNLLLQREGARLPGGTKPEVLAQTVRTLLIARRGFVGSPALWAKEKSGLRLWTHPSPVEGPELFRRYCRDPQLYQSSGEWTLQFYYFNPQGGVESWNVVGDAGRIREATFTPAVPDGTFLFPYA